MKNNYYNLKFICRVKRYKPCKREILESITFWSIWIPHI